MSLKQLLQHEVILYDLEYTAWEGSKARGWSGENEHREIVEIGAIKTELSGSTLVVKNEFNCLVRPNKNPILSDYFIDLTGITNAEIEETAISFTDAYTNFSTFIGSTAPLLSFGEDDEILKENMELNAIAASLDSNRFYNYRDELCSLLNIDKSVTSSELPASLKLDYKGKKHRALGDVMAQLATINHAIQNKQL